MAHGGPTREAIRRVKKRAEQDLLKLANVHAVDIAEKYTGGEPTGELSIVVYVDRKRKQVAAKDRVPEEVDGISTDVQEQEPDVLHPALLRLEPDEVTLDASRYDTVAGGMGIGPCRAIYMEPPYVPAEGYYVTVGTLGAIVRDRSSGEALILTNFHVAAVDDGWSVGDDIAQPARNDGGNCPADRVGSLQRAVLSSNVDGAVVSIEERPYACEILAIGDVKGSKAAAEGAAVRKRGRTTELTHGEVISTDYSTTIDFGDGLGSVTLVDQIRIAVDGSQSEMFGTSGDSGSVVVDDDGYLVGLYFAGNSSGTRGVANPIAKVLSELDIEVCVTPKVFDPPKYHHWEGPPWEVKEWWYPEKPHKEWLKWEKPEKEKPEKPEFERWGGGAWPIEEKDPRWEKDVRAEKGPQMEKGPHMESAVPPGSPRQPGPAPRSVGSRRWPDPWAPSLKNFFDAPEGRVKDPKEFVPDKPEYKENKNETKENKEIKDDKDLTYEGPGGAVAPPVSGWHGGWSAPHGGRQHFIPQHLRPDLSAGALRNEPR